MIAHAVAYLFGTVLGVISGWGLSFWFTGVTGWLLLLFVTWHNAVVDPNHLYDSRRSRAVAWGAAFGAWSGAAAADVPEVLGALVWPGHETDGVFFAFLVALAWLIGCIISPDDEVDQPMRAGLGLYVVVVVLSYGPPLWEVLPW